ncbi:MAG: hypothetical protein M0017_13830 [Desulfobacteraceae bacterium]|nr:hypothetical protein [Desulfobacteraceae bacterium]
MNSTRQVLGWLFLVAVLVVHSPSSTAAEGPAAISQDEIDLASRNMAVAAKEKELAAKEAQLKQLEKELQSRMARLNELQAQVEAKLATLQTGENEQLKNLVKVYNSMKPTQVAPLLGRMEDDEVVSILKLMKTETVAQIMAKLDPDKAVRVSKQLGMIK